MTLLRSRKVWSVLLCLILKGKLLKFLLFFGGFSRALAEKSKLEVFDFYIVF